MKRTLYFLTITCTLLLACTCRNNDEKNTNKENTPPVELDRAIFHNVDSLNYYADLAYNSDDPKALFITGIASHVRYYDPEFPKDAKTVSPNEGEYYLIRAAELGSEDAITYIRCMVAHDSWRHFVPDNCK